MSFLQDANRVFQSSPACAGLPGDALAFVLADVAAEGRWLIVVDGPDQAGPLVQSLRFFHRHPDRVCLFPADDVRPYDGFSPQPEMPIGRMRTLHRVEKGEPVIVVAPVAALLQRVPDSTTRARGTRELRAGFRIERDDLVRWLQDGGYLATGRVEQPGQLAVRGDVLDVWLAGTKAPVRVDFFDDELEEIRRFDPSSQRTTERLPRVLALPMREERLDEEALERLSRELGRLVTIHQRGISQRRRVFEELRSGIRFSGMEAWLPALAPTTAPLDVLSGLTRVVVQPQEVRNAAREFERACRERWEALDEEERPLVPPSERYVNADTVLSELDKAFSVEDVPVDGRSVDLGARLPEGFGARGGELGPAAKQLRELRSTGARVGVVVDGARKIEPILELLNHHELHPTTRASPWDIHPGEIAVLSGELRRGFVAKDSGFAFIPVSAFFGERQRTHRMEKAHAFFDSSVSSLAELKSGDFVVHRMHGIGLFRGLQRVPIEDVEQDFVKVEYRDGDLLLLPVTRLEQISRYVPAHESAEVKLDRLGGVTWAARKAKVRDSILKMAQELLGIYAKRELATRSAYPPPRSLVQAFEATFPYEETVDQAAAIEAVNEDLSKEEPMDRLLCGDVGYGKTEVAMRAAVRVVEGGRQVAVLCPTTVLAFQHHQRFSERFSGFPVRVEMVSRFRTGPEETVALDGLRTGNVNIVIGTTRLLGRGVRFSDLGLVVIDEEHRFGVRQKERFKKLRAEVDVLSMSATPIPRTLQMALSGMREMSLMATAPRDRLAVRTTVAKLSRNRIRDAILYELERKGQVFFVHNRVENIEEMAITLREWVPEARLAVAHGQMVTEELEDVLIEFIAGRIDVLVTSAIIESGVDLPNVNTMFIHRADRFGLAQLYQLRGRVGRGAIRGNCILLVPEEMTSDARRRVRALVENAELGAGFRIAVADLEMRGAGNLLGDAQSGNIDAIGYEAWLELLEGAVHQARGEIDRARIDPEVEVPVAAFLPENLVPDLHDRLEWYRRLSGTSTEAEVDRWLDAFEDQLGEPPIEVKNLAGLALTRVLCRELGIVRCSWLKVRVLLELHPATPIPIERLREIVAESPKRFQLLEKEDARSLEVRFLPQEAEWPFRFLRWVLAQLGRRDVA